MRALVEGGKDLATNNPLAPSRKGLPRDPPLATQINLWINYVDMVKINILRVTKHGGSIILFVLVQQTENQRVGLDQIPSGRKAESNLNFLQSISCARF